MSTPDVALIDLEDVSFSVDGKEILRDVTLSVAERRIGVIGRNGSGKTTLARVMAGLVTPDRGKARVGGVEVARDRKAALAQVGILFQNPDHQIIFPTVEEEIAFGLKQAGQSAAEVQQGVEQILARFDRAHWAKAAIHELSQGQRQLVCLMAVLAMQPKVVILDEPFSGLDIPTARQLARVLDSLPVTLVQITHDPAALRGYERVVWLEEGQIAMDGAAKPVLDAFTTRMEQLGASDDLSDLAG